MVQDVLDSGITLAVSLHRPIMRKNGILICDVLMIQINNFNDITK